MHYDKREQVEALWADLDNWKWGAIYICEADPRVVVPKRLRWTGWTVNFAHKLAWAVLFALVAIAIVPTFVLIALGMLTVFTITVAMTISIAVIIAWSAWLASRY